jgi:hypothetical protein
VGAALEGAPLALDASAVDAEALEEMEVDETHRSDPGCTTHDTASVPSSQEAAAGLASATGAELVRLPATTRGGGEEPSAPETASSEWQEDLSLRV